MNLNSPDGRLKHSAPLFTWKEALANRRLDDGMPLALVQQMSGSIEAERLTLGAIKTARVRWVRMGQI